MHPPDHSWGADDVCPPGFFALAADLLQVEGQVRRLRINYRTTDETRRWAVGLLKGIDIDDVDGGVDDQRGYKSLLHGVDPVVQHFDNFSDEIEFLKEHLQNLENQGAKLNGVCLVARTKPLQTSLPLDSAASA